ncbi:SAM-dependent methyltransferase [Frigidibacter oleivorans]|uniref:SAM-dependent methyltransferase n=1 Tax=Frigidibacter oleivorans TaxID=2487129 RepID=UPI000F8DA234|nr:cyclopropane-fatty-acyl-phospholipid synthase family protein [Frigidibacter oleivorans]
MWPSLLDQFLSRFLQIGSLRLSMPDGTLHRYGDGTAPEVAVALTDPDLPRRLVLSPDLTLGEAYMDGTLTVGDDDVRGLLTLLLRNLNRPGARRRGWIAALDTLSTAGRRLQQWNPVSRSRRNVAHHYDLSGALYDLFLDEDRQYSCAYFRHPDDTLDQAQRQKKAHIAAKLRLQPGMRVLDIGCGWGGMALTLARDHGAQVLGVTLSEEQHRVATERVRAAGLGDRIEIRLTDYRRVTGRFDRIVSVGMFEHVGLPQYRTYFGKVRELLDQDGIALIHTIGRAAPPAATSAFIRKYIFPGGYVPALSEAMRAVEAQDLWTTDVEIWRLHYAETLRHWEMRVSANADRIVALYDARFLRMWRYYLIASELSFREGRQCVFQIQLAPRVATVPLTRDYLYPAKDVVPGQQELAAE